MTKKDYQRIAAAINESRKTVLKTFHSPSPDTVYSEVVKELSQALKSDNTKFDAERFRDACLEIRREVMS